MRQGGCAACAPMRRVSVPQRLCADAARPPVPPSFGSAFATRAWPGDTCRGRELGVAARTRSRGADAQVVLFLAGLTRASRAGVLCLAGLAGLARQGSRAGCCSASVLLGACPAPSSRPLCEVAPPVGVANSNRRRELAIAAQVVLVSREAGRQWSSSMVVVNGCRQCCVRRTLVESDPQSGSADPVLPRSSAPLANLRPGSRPREAFPGRPRRRDVRREPAACRTSPLRRIRRRCGTAPIRSRCGPVLGDRVRGRQVAAPVRAGFPGRSAPCFWIRLGFRCAGQGT